MSFLPAALFKQSVIQPEVDKLTQEVNVKLHEMRADKLEYASVYALCSKEAQDIVVSNLRSQSYIVEHKYQFPTGVNGTCDMIIVRLPK